jgi:hypothetical protein
MGRFWFSWWRCQARMPTSKNDHATMPMQQTNRNSRMSRAGDMEFKMDQRSSDNTAAL